MVTTRDRHHNSPRRAVPRTPPRQQRGRRTRTVPAVPVTVPAQETQTLPAAPTPHIPTITSQVSQQTPVTVQSIPHDHPVLVEVNAEIATLRQQNLALQQRMDQLQQEQDPNSLENVPIEKPQPLVDAIMSDSVPPNFKPPHLENYDGKRDPQEHLTAFDTQMAIIGAHDTLKCKLFSGTMKDAALRWYMSLPRNSISNYADFTKKFIRHFSDRKHRKTTTATLFNTRQAPNESLREYLGRFSDITVDVEHPDQRQFADAFANGLRGGQFNESLAYRPASNMQEVLARAEAYMKGEERNAEKRSRDDRERGNDNRGGGRYRPDESQRNTSQKRDTLRRASP